MQADGHSDSVTAVCWSEQDSLLYSCSTDGNIAEWSAAKSRCRQLVQLCNSYL